MKRLRLPKTSTPKGLKTYCNKCKAENTLCAHIDRQVYRGRFHIKGTKNGVIIVTLEARVYENAVQEFMELKKKHNNNLLGVKVKIESVAVFSLVEAVKSYVQYISGNYKYKHKERKNLTSEYVKEITRNVIKFPEFLSSVGVKVKELYVNEVTQVHVSDFYENLEQNFKGRTMNKVLAQVKAFFDFLIEVEEMKMDNPFNFYNTAQVGGSKKLIIRKEEFEKILLAVDDPAVEHTHDFENGVRKNMNFPYLKDGFKLALFTGARREEMVNLRRSDLQITPDGTRFFVLKNLKINRQALSKKQVEEDNEKYSVVNADFLDFLYELGYDQKKNSNDYIIAPDRTVKSATIMNNLSKSFSHYRRQAGIDKVVQLKTLRKTYLTWLYVAMNKNTRELSGHASDEVLQRFYLNPEIINTIDKASNFKLFGT